MYDFSLNYFEFPSVYNSHPVCLYTEIVAFNEGAIRNNAIVVEYCRTSMAALGGGTAGILGLTGYLAGFGFYLFCVVILWVRI